MKYGPLVFLAAFLALSASWYGFVLTPQIQLGRAVQETNSVIKAELYPAGRPGLARQGLEVYRAQGCVYCHSQQVEQKGTLVDVMLTDVGKNSMDVASALNGANLGKFSGPSVGAGLPKPILRGVSMDAATALGSLLKKAGANTELHLVPTGTDIERGWGMRRTVAEDFIFDATAMPGSQRVGPDLANVGQRRPDMNWHLQHLYAPASEVPGSPMPSYKFLFEVRKLKPGQAPSADAIPWTAAGHAFDASQNTGPVTLELVPKPEARALAAYLLSLRSDTPLYEAPLTPPSAPATNAPAK